MYIHTYIHAMLQANLPVYVRRLSGDDESISSTNP